MLKLVLPLPYTQEKYPTRKESDPLTQFISEIRSQGPNLYLMLAQDPSHHLSCELILEVDRNQEKYNGGTVICHFSKLIDTQLKYLINHDETLCEIIIVQFQMKILEQLFLFCATNYVSKIIIYTSGAKADELEIYREFLIYQGQALTEKSEQTEIRISADPQTFDGWIDFMNKVTLTCRQLLWQDQRINSTIRQYLKTHPLG